ncbi:hypothetical protein [Oceanirhabdus sp. W0125-5]|uniref:hypothetical protein n=1 Tax=Oceanirhabdus sp. W0125-5 TaxID=2999116 RepID=UPI0022F2AC35|nr:hypothetical protein [Oceanirhabdus sp. W0125-5]WBW95410.1 hypothetical protein OW730_17160 [Oceanirhabdus sp. W0125-5]
MNIVLISIGLILIITAMFEYKKDKGKHSFKKEFKNAIDNANDYKVEIGKLRKEFSETILELQKEIYQVKRLENSKSDEFLKNIENKEGNESVFSEKTDIEEVGYSSNIEMIRKLINEGKDIEEVCGLTKMPKGEVLLVKELYL